MSASPPRSRSVTDITMGFIRYGIGAIMVAGGVIMLVVSPAGLGVDGFAMAVGGGLSVLLLNYMYRLSVTSEEDRAHEERARAYFDEHGEWPEEQADVAAGPRILGRSWALPAGAVTAEAEANATRSADDLAGRTA
jgi:hypothetical protein